MGQQRTPVPLRPPGGYPTLLTAAPAMTVKRKPMQPGRSLTGGERTRSKQGIQWVLALPTISVEVNTRSRTRSITLKPCNARVVAGGPGAGGCGARAGGDPLPPDRPGPAPLGGKGRQAGPRPPPAGGVWS